ncbi:lipopolysaccharide biosynthesis protein [Polaribacter sp. Asnod1-A03]|uniref:lipopolysaccharide biosynthesis protein n=1 Tax=Polaribacter sp. Asnod1-A03 TaxID=3160581 RepID=UPI00386443C1
MSKVKKNILKNGIATVFQKGIKVLQQLFLVPFFITAWGAAYYGEWLTLTIIPSVIAFSDLGFGTAAANSFVLAYASGDKQKAANISKSGIFIITIMITLAVLISIAAIVILGEFNVFEKSLIQKEDAIWAVSILILARLLAFYSQLIESYYRAAQKAALSINLLTIRAALNIGAGLLVLLLGYGIVGFALSQLIVIFCFNIFYFIKGRSVIGLFKTHQGQRDKQELKVITNKGLGYLMSPVWQALYFQGSTFAIRIVLGPEAVAVFNTVRTLSRSVNQLLNIISSSIFPELQFEIGAGNIKKAQKIFRVAIFSSLLVAFVGALFLAFFGLWFYKIWTHNELDLPPLMWYIFVIGILFNAFWWTASVAYKAVNKPYQFAILGVVCAAISVIVTYFASSYIGLTGAAIGSVTLDVLMAVLIMPRVCKLLNINAWDLFTHGWEDIKEIFGTFLKKIKKIA